jgi:small subunit ribosomal protein S7
MKLLLFNRWETDVEVSDPGLKRYVNLKPFVVPKTSGRFSTTSIHKVDMSIVERFINKLAVPGHKGKKHRLTSGHVPGRYSLLYRSVKEAFEIIEKRTKANPLQILVRAVENGALLEEVVGYRMGGIIARKAVVTSPHRRLDVSLRMIAQDIADELIEIANNEQRNNVIRERTRIEKEAEGAR